MSPPLPPDREERLEALFHQALQRSGPAREDFLARACGEDRALREELVELLAAHGRSPACLESPAWGVGSQLGRLAATLVGERVGDYVLRELLGEGGMGSVYLAEQVQPFRRLVALKLIKPGMDTAEVVRRFQSERQALALLGHRNVAAVHDAGVTPRGLPFFVMEYVPGERITEYCDRRRLTIEQRLGVLLQVCAAVQHAHQKGIIHRDLKPSNILVKEEDGQPLPKIIDFGVAKAIAGPSGAATRLTTRHGQLIGTPGYMSPEQACAGPATVDTRTDVYSLGALLYELLTGAPPLDVARLHGASDEQVRRLLAESEPARPSLRVAGPGPGARRVASRRRTDPKGLQRRLRGDLDWITMKALERDPERRYASADLLAADLAAHLERDPVSAGPPGALYRARKLAARHRRPVMAAASALLAVVGTLGALAWIEHGRSRDLADENAAMRRTQEHISAARDALQERNVAMQEACDAARDVTGAPRPALAVTVLNASSRPLRPGELVEVLGPGPTVDGELVLRVGRARLDSGHVLLGAVDGALQAVDGAGSHEHEAPVAIPAGGRGLVLTQGPVAALAVDGAPGPITEGSLLVLSAEPGLAAASSPESEATLVGRALTAWDEPGRGTVLAWLAPGRIDGQALAARTLAALLPGGIGPVAGSVTTVGPPRSPGASDGASPTGATTLVLVGGPALAAADDAPGVDRGGVTADPTDAAGTPMMPSKLGGKTSTSADGLAGTAQGTPQPLLVPALPPSPAGAPTVAEAQGVLGGQGQGMATGGGGLAKGGGTGGPPPAAGEGVVTGGGGGAEVHAMSKLDQSWADVDDDGLLDVLVYVGAGLTLLHNGGQGAFVDVTAWSNLSGLASPRQADFVDADGNTLPDLLVVDGEGRLHLELSAGGGRFTDATTLAGLDGLPPAESVTAFDADGDGRQDLRLLTTDGVLLLLRNDGTGRYAVTELARASQAVSGALPSSDPVGSSAGTGPTPADGGAVPASGAGAQPAPGGLH